MYHVHPVTGEIKVCKLQKGMYVVVSRDTNECVQSMKQMCTWLAVRCTACRYDSLKKRLSKSPKELALQIALILYSIKYIGSVSVKIQNFKDRKTFLKP